MERFLIAELIPTQSLSTPLHQDRSVHPNAAKGGNVQLESFIIPSINLLAVEYPRLVSPSYNYEYWFFPMALVSEDILQYIAFREF